MPNILIRHKVADYDKWKPLYDEHGAVRKAGGSKGARLFRNANDPSEIVILIEWDSIQNAQQFVASNDLHETMQRAGVIGQPDIYFLEEIQWTPA